MSDHPRARTDGSPDGPRRPAGSPGPGFPASDEEELARRITQALRARAATHPDPSVVAARIEARLADAPAGSSGSSVSTLRRRGGRVVLAGVVGSTIAVAGAGAAAASNPYSEVARAVENVAQAVGVDWSFMPAGYTRAQYEAFWGAGHTVEDVETLSALWDLDVTETKAKAGQLLLDGQALPLGDVTRTPVDLGLGEPVVGDDPAEAFWAAGYTYEDAVALSELWSDEVYETKVRAGQMILDGGEPPIEPGSAPTPPATPDAAPGAEVPDAGMSGDAWAELPPEKRGEPRDR
ncbi:hypothetical protein [Cellulomonas cellasea]|uniref:Uncharacterized protein n=1 Tax=Cellulomonas cellasea TaxID=43670 RepID=A0A7W4UGE8_9CELL|nr:hypothetical protein [Cellulomonas cellasea]MBB2923329.1 hypothetical protein [Cellulomonas cellasea]